MPLRFAGASPIRSADFSQQEARRRPHRPRPLSPTELKQPLLRGDSRRSVGLFHLSRAVAGSRSDFGRQKSGQALAGEWRARRHSRTSAYALKTGQRVKPRESPSSSPSKLTWRACRLSVRIRKRMRTGEGTPSRRPRPRIAFPLALHSSTPPPPESHLCGKLFESFSIAEEVCCKTGTTGGMAFQARKSL